MLYVWAHPQLEKDRKGEEMNWLFFLNLLAYISHASEGKAEINLVQVTVSR